LHLKSVSDVVVDELCCSDETVSALLAVGSSCRDTKVIDVEADDKSGVRLREAVKNWL
jgi:hypothetical protein